MPKSRRANLWALTVAVLTMAGIGAGAPAAAAGQLHPSSTATAASRPGHHAAGPPHGAVAAHPDLTTNTPAPCGRPKHAGDARCFAIVRTPADHVLTADSSGPPATALGPADIQSAYNLPSATAGSGQAVAVVDAGDDPNAEADLAVFRSQYGLSPCTTANGCFARVNQEGQQGSYPFNWGWGAEISLDLDAVSAACPNCHILLVEANSPSSDDLGASVNEAVSLGADAVSNSYGTSTPNGLGVEISNESSYDHYYNHPGVAVTASAGDGGWGVTYPAASPFVTAVGGTTLTKDTSVARGWDETVWGNGTEGTHGDGTGSGCSAYEPQEYWQAGVAQNCPMRATADVSADASPVSGLAVYDTYFEGGWLQIGGTSLSSPLIAAMYALAGTPTAGSYPSSYLYAHYLGGPSAFNDVTSGSNGDCGNVLCSAGAGWDGPTGVGTPDGVAGLADTQAGSITGTVTDAATGQPVAGATVSLPHLSVTTRSDGSYALPAVPALPAGSYQVSVSGYGYQSQSQAVTVTAGQPATQNFQLTGSAHQTVSGTVTDGSGHGWPLYAKITVSGVPAGPVWTDPSTGRYAITLPSGSYTLDVSVTYPGYQTEAVPVTVSSSGVVANVSMPVDASTCVAPGYQFHNSGHPQAFRTGQTPPGWSTSNLGTGAGWVFSNPGNRVNRTGGNGKFAIVDSDYDGFGTTENAYLTTPVLNLAAAKTPIVQFAQSFRDGSPTDTAAVQLSVNGGHTWTTLATEPKSQHGQTVIPVPQAAGKKKVQVRFNYQAPTWAWWWELDNVFVGNRSCDPVPGGLVLGTVTDATTSAPLNGATVTSATSPSETGTAAGTGDPATPGGFYWLFAGGTGPQSFTAAAAGHSPSTQSVNVTANGAVRADFTLTQLQPGG